MTDDLDLSPLAAGPDLLLAPVASVKARGDQRRRRSRVVTSGAAALLVAAAAGSAVALAGSAKPDALVPTSPSPDSAPTALEDHAISWAAFPRVTDVARIVSGASTSGQLHITSGEPVYDRCPPHVALTTPRATADRSWFSRDGQGVITLTLDDFSGEGSARDTFEANRMGYARCPVISTDGAAGSRATATVLESSPDAFTARQVLHGCRRDHGGCTDHTELLRVQRAGHLVLTVRSFDAMGAPLSGHRIKDLMDLFALRANGQFGQQPPDLPHPSPQPAKVGHVYVGAILWSEGAEGRAALQVAREQSRGWTPTLLTRSACLDVRGEDQNLRGDVLVVLFADAQDAEDFLDQYDGYVEGATRSLDVRCLS